MFKNREPPTDLWKSCLREKTVYHAPDMMNICGAYLLPTYGGQGMFEALLYYMEAVLSREGYRGWE